jgi:hypothetical protein
MAEVAHGFWDSHFKERGVGELFFGADAVLLEEFVIVDDVAGFFVVWVDSAAGSALELAGDHFLEGSILLEEMAGEEFAFGEVYIIAGRYFILGLDKGKSGEAVARSYILLIDFMFPVVLGMHTREYEHEVGNREYGEASEHE